MQSKTNRLHNYSKQLGLMINISKTKVMRINTKSDHAINIEDQPVEMWMSLSTREVTSAQMEELTRMWSNVSAKQDMPSENCNSSLHSSPKTPKSKCLTQTLNLFYSMAVKPGRPPKHSTVNCKCLLTTASDTY